MPSAASVHWAVVIFTACALSCIAGPAAPAAFTLNQLDGTAFQARLVGDEWGNWMETISGFTIVRDETTGMWVYAVTGSEGELTAGTEPVGEGAPSGSRQHLRPKSTAGPPLGASGTLIPGTAYAPPNQGIHHTLVLVVDFTPSTLVGVTSDYWSDRFFGPLASVADYFHETSYGQISLAPAAESDTSVFGGVGGAVNDGVVYVQLGYEHPNTGGLTGNANRQLVFDAIVASDPAVAYGSFDANHDGYLSTDELHIVTVVAGCEMSYGIAGIPNVWAHQWSLGSWYDENQNDVLDSGEYVPAPAVDGVVIGHSSGGSSGTKGGYTQIGEWHGISLSIGHAATIGVVCHELGHDMGSGVPDLYDTDGSSAGIGSWCLQAAGAWNWTTHLGDTPAHWCAWAKWYLGLLVPTQLTTSANDVAFPRVEDAIGLNHGVFQVLDNPLGIDFVWWGASGTGEYFLLENRQQIGYDAGLPGSGLCIWHIYEASPTDNTANDNEGSVPPGNPRLVVLEQMDGRFDLEGFGITGAANWGDATDPWTCPNEFHDASTPSSKLYSGNPTWVSVADISTSKATMTADLSLSPPAPDSAAVFRVDSTGNVYADGTFYGARFQSGSADVAEWVDVSEPVDVGDVLELDPDRLGACRKARRGCSSLVVGVVSTDPGVILGSAPKAQYALPFASHSQALLTLIGIVPVKACDEGGPIELGDLLVASSSPGHVMRWSGEDPFLCALVGKALEPMNQESGVIRVLLTAH